jgi:Zn-finger nucleic acid-binding protein
MAKRKLPLPCPRCHSELTERQLGAIAIDICEACGGHWYDAGELERVRQMGPAERPRGLPDPRPPRWVDSKALDVVCPRCREPLGADRYAYSSDLVIDRCPTCHGVWVDAGELEKMDHLVDEWSRDLEKDAVAWKDRLGEVEKTFGRKIKETERSTRLGALLGFFWDVLARGPRPK